MKKRTIVHLTQGLEVGVNFLKPGGIRVVSRLRAGVAEATVLERGQDDRLLPVACLGLTLAIGRVLELRIPFDCIGVSGPVLRMFRDVLAESK